MKSRVVTWILLAVIVMTPTLVFAQAQQPDISSPPISQPLVREGTFAVRLVRALNIGNTTNETEAESVLSKAGIAPANGWISDYPVTPDILGDLKSSITKATQAGTIESTEANALNALQATENYFAMSVASAPGTPPDEQASSGYYDDTVTNNYYSSEGPPVVTYYAPPPDYSYLYTWVPYPFWWWGWWFGGYYMLTTFTLPTFYGYWPGVWYPYHSWYGKNYCYRNWYGNIYWGNHGPWNNPNLSHATVAISNHFRNPVTGSIGTINPRTRIVASSTNGQGFSHWAIPGAEAGAKAIFNASRGSISAAAPHIQGLSSSSYTTRTYNQRLSAPTYGHGRIPSYSPNKTYAQPNYALHYSTFPNRSQFSSRASSGQGTSNSAMHSYGAHSFSASGMRYSSGGFRGFSGGRR